ncbi:skin secretory protein xP2-like [Melozone crissalis]|uniref:skin secretory protein xP2-like n=1 Tax=Melozone crissalis TaxID=40204 RepID=UPI0023DBC320|nr:skin secretory protein xP2-like [Melozone crissalis]
MAQPRTPVPGSKEKGPTLSSRLVHKAFLTEGDSPCAPVRLEEAAAAAPGPKRGRQPRPPGLAPSGPPAPPQERPQGPWPAASGCGATRSLAGRTLTGAGAVRGDQRSAAEVISAARREARDLGCGRCAPAAEPALRRARPPFPASLANAGRARSRLEPSVARRLPQPLAGGSRPSAAKEGQACREPAAPARSSSPGASRGLGPSPASLSPPRNRPVPRLPLLPQRSAPLTTRSAPQECQVGQREDPGCQGAKASCETDPPQQQQAKGRGIRRAEPLLGRFPPPRGAGSAEGPALPALRAGGERTAALPAPARPRASPHTLPLGGADPGAGTSTTCAPPPSQPPRREEPPGGAAPAARPAPPCPRGRSPAPRCHSPTAGSGGSPRSRARC